jgi:hypothetical protein
VKVGAKRRLAGFEFFAVTGDLFGASAAFTTVPLWSRIGSPVALASGAGRKRLAKPVAQGFAHDEVEVAALEPRQFLGEQGQALPPQARHPGDVSAPEHPLGTEGVETAMQMRMQAADWLPRGTPIWCHR